jgi:hypothetical protein
MYGAAAALNIASDVNRITPLPAFQLPLYSIGGVRIRLARIGVLLWLNAPCHPPCLARPLDVSVAGLFASVEHFVTRATKVGLMIARVEGDRTLRRVHELKPHGNTAPRRHFFVLHFIVS